MLKVPKGEKKKKDWKGICFIGSDFDYGSTLVIHQIRLQALFTRFTTETHANQAYQCVIIATGRAQFWQRCIWSECLVPEQQAANGEEQITVHFS